MRTIIALITFVRRLDVYFITIREATW